MNDCKFIIQRAKAKWGRQGWRQLSPRQRELEVQSEFFSIVLGQFVMPGEKENELTVWGRDVAIAFRKEEEKL